MPPVPSVPLAIRPGWSGSQSSADGKQYYGSNCAKTAAQHAPPTLPWAVRGINAQRRSIFLPPGTLSQHGSAALRASTVTLQPSPRLPQPGALHRVPTGSLQLSPRQHLKPCARAFAGAGAAGDEQRLQGMARTSFPPSQAAESVRHGIETGSAVGRERPNSPFDPSCLTWSRFSSPGN